MSDNKDTVDLTEEQKEFLSSLDEVEDELLQMEEVEPVTDEELDELMRG